MFRSSLHSHIVFVILILCLLDQIKLAVALGWHPYIVSHVRVRTFAHVSRLGGMEPSFCFRLGTNYQLNANK